MVSRIHSIAMCLVVCCAKCPAICKTFGDAFLKRERDCGPSFRQNDSTFGPRFSTAAQCFEHKVPASSVSPISFSLLPMASVKPPVNMLLSSARTTAAPRLASIARHFSTTPAMFEVKKLGVIGAGQMGLGIALVAAQKALVNVTLVDNSQASLDKGMAFADKLLAKDLSKQRITQEILDQTRSRIHPTTQMSDLSDVDFVIEAVPEIPSLKEKIFAELAQVCPKHAILATNTSSISITRIAAATTKDPTDTSASSRVISTHFMNPVPVQKGVEIISGLQTSQSTVDVAIEFCKAMGKIPSVSADSPGFLANRILMPYINEAIICLETGVGKKEDIDNIMKNGTNVPMGPLTLADFIGLDTCLAIMETLHAGLGDSKYRPSVLLRQYVDAGWLGKKSGKGFYDY
jgi:3-hydroxybutyryl-CoA dehydrogenase